MQRKTTTKQIQNAIKNKLLILERSEIYNKSTRKTKEIPNDRFLENFDYLCESGIFVDSIGWYFERNYKNGIYEVESSRMDGCVDVIITACFRKSDDVTDETVKEMLLKAEI